MNHEGYREHIDQMIREMSGELVLNGSHHHATIILERMLANARQRVSVLASRLDERIFGVPETIEQAERFVAQPSHELRILVEPSVVPRLATHPFFARMQGAIDVGSLQIRSLSEIASNLPVNFTLMDDDGYRFESDKEQAIATAAFQRNDFVGRLNELFGSMWGPPSKVVELKVVPA